MRQGERMVAAVLIVACLGIPACREAAEPEETAGHEPATKELVEGTEFYRVTLTEEAAGRLGIKTVPVQIADSQIEGATLTVIPYAAVVYGTNGETWTYANPEPLVFVRETITLARIDGDLAILSAGPVAGTAVVTVGAAELLGVEYEVGH